jgi:hypothetical protein
VAAGAEVNDCPSTKDGSCVVSLTGTPPVCGEAPTGVAASTGAGWPPVPVPVPVRSRWYRCGCGRAGAQTQVPMRGERCGHRYGAGEAAGGADAGTGAGLGLVSPKPASAGRRHGENRRTCGLTLAVQRQEQVPDAGFAARRPERVRAWLLEPVPKPQRPDRRRGFAHHWCRLGRRCRRSIDRRGGNDAARSAAVAAVRRWNSGRNGRFRDFRGRHFSGCLPRPSLADAD